MQITKLSEFTGAVIEGVDLSQPLCAADQKTILDAFHEHLVVFFKGQFLTHEQHATFARLFGKLHMHGKKEFGETPTPEIVTVSNVEKNGHLGSGEVFWHTDTSFYQNPPTFSFLRAHEVTRDGGQTYWTNMYAAYDRLSDEMKSRLENLLVRHDNRYNAVGEARVALKNAQAENRELEEGATHPILRKHPVTGKTALFYGRIHHNQVIGLSEGASQVLLEELEKVSTVPNLVCQHSWTPGDLAVWDNRCTMHRRDPFPNEQRRVMYRCQVYSE